MQADLQLAVTQFARAVRSRVPLGCDCAHWFSHEVSFAGQLFTQAVKVRQSESPAHALSSLQQLCDTHWLHAGCENGIPREQVEPGTAPPVVPPPTAFGALHSAAQELAMQPLRSLVGTSSEQAPPFVHWAHDASAKHAVTCEQQLCSRHMPHALFVLR